MVSRTEVSEALPQTEQPDESSSFLSSLHKLLHYFNTEKKTSLSEAEIPLVGVGQESYEDLQKCIATARYEVISLEAQIGAFERMSLWVDQVALKSLRRPDLDKVSARLLAKEKILSALIYEKIVQEEANAQHVKVEALEFEENYLKYLIGEMLDKGDPEDEMIATFIRELGRLKNELSEEKGRLQQLRQFPAKKS